jgi:methyl-accepting chemotaxis protein
VFSSWLKDQRQQLALAGAADGVFSGVSRVSARAQEVTTETAEVVAAMSSASRDALEKVQQSGKIIQTVQEVAHQIRILSINGSMEAARAGAQGRPFAVVAREMLDLSESARGAANQIETTLGEVQQAIGELTKAIDRSAALANTQSSALTEVKSVVDELQRVVSQLTGEGNG